MLLNELERQGIAAGAYTIGLSVVGTLEGTLAGAVIVAGASTGPLVSVVAVGRSRG